MLPEASPRASEMAIKSPQIVKAPIRSERPLDDKQSGASIKATVLIYPFVKPNAHIKTKNRKSPKTVGKNVGIFSPIRS